MDEDIFLDMLEDRNRTSHIYSEEVSRQIFTRIKKDYLNPIKGITSELKKSTSS
jgi:hypothetical protein